MSSASSSSALNNNLKQSKSPTKSASLGNFDCLNKTAEDDDNISATGSGKLTGDTISISSASSDHKKSVEKQWYVVANPFCLEIQFLNEFILHRIETSLDGPVIKQRSTKDRGLLQRSMSPPPPMLHQREKKKLSSQSMHSPSGRSNYSYSTAPATEKQQYPLPISVSVDFPQTQINVYPDQQNNVYQFHHHHHPPTHLHTHHQDQLQHSPNYYQPILPQKHLLQSQKQRAVRRTESTLSNLIPEPQPSARALHPPPLPSPNNNSSISPAPESPSICIESPKNMTVIQQAKFQPYKEVTKPFLMSDFYKYSTKFRQKTNDPALLSPNNQSSVTNVPQHHSLQQQQPLMYHNHQQSHQLHQ